LAARRVRRSRLTLGRCRLEDTLQRGTHAIRWNDPSERIYGRPVGPEKEEMRRRFEAKRSPRVRVGRVGDVEVNKVDPPSVLLLEPVDHGRHGLAAESAGVEELHQLRASCLCEQRDIARVVPHAICLGTDRRLVGTRAGTHLAKRDPQNGDSDEGRHRRDNRTLHE